MTMGRLEAVFVVFGRQKWRGRFNLVRAGYFWTPSVSAEPTAAVYRATGERMRMRTASLHLCHSER